LHNVERDWTPALQAAKIPDFRFHDCRHTFASRLAMLGTDLYTVQRAGGWKTPMMVQRYAHLSPDHIWAAVERLARRNAGPHPAPKPALTNLPAQNKARQVLDIQWCAWQESNLRPSA